MVELVVQLFNIIRGGLDAEINIINLSRNTLDLFLGCVCIILDTLLLLEFSLVELLASLNFERWVMLLD